MNDVCTCPPDGTDMWGPCFECMANRPPIDISERDTGQINYDTDYYSRTVTTTVFKPDPLYYHHKLKDVIVLNIGNQFTEILYKGIQLTLPNKIIRYKGKKNKMYVHTNIFNTILNKKLLEIHGA